MTNNPPSPSKSQSLFLLSFSQPKARTALHFFKHLSTAENNTPQLHSGFTNHFCRLHTTQPAVNGHPADNASPKTFSIFRNLSTFLHEPKHALVFETKID